MIALIILDMAGTAINEDNLVYKTIQHSLHRFGYQVPLETVLRFGAGKEKRDAIMDIIRYMSNESPDKERVEEIYNDFHNSLTAGYATEPMEVFKGAEELVRYCRQHDISVALNTGYQREIANQILERVGLKMGDDFDFLATADQVEQGRPAPDMILLICEKLNIPPFITMKIGDSGVDIEEGRNAGVKLTVGVTTGAQNREMLKESRPDFIVDDLSEVIGILMGEAEE